MNGRSIKDYNTLFLDRDGTINRRKEGGYISSVDEFEFLPGVLEAMYLLAPYFDHIIIVTNQQGIGKGIMNEDELAEIHDNMLSTIKRAGGRIDQIYHCPFLSIDNPLCRKPNPGMALQAQEDFPYIEFEKSVMIGDADSDIAFAKNLNMMSIRIYDKSQSQFEKSDRVFFSLIEFSRWWVSMI